jgi:uncharacterized membrane protein YgaE (UPF0421/DUF939 family)
MTVLTIAAILEAEWIFVHVTHALQIQAHGTLPAVQAAKVSAANHEYLVILMLVGAILGMISAFGVMDSTARGQLITMVFLPVPMVAALTTGIALGAHRVLSLVLLAVVLALGTYCRRFGPRGMIAGLLLFMGYFLGFFLHAAVGIGDIGWLVAAVGVGLVVAIAIRFVFFYPRPAKALARTQRSYAARARKVAALALDLFDDPDHSEREVRRLHRQLVRLNEAALMIDAQLGGPGAVADGSSAQLLHQRLFDVELALTNVARFAVALTRLDLAADQRSEIRLVLSAIVGRDQTGVRAHAARLLALLPQPASSTSDDDTSAVVVPHRFAGSATTLADAMVEWLDLGATQEAAETFQPAVTLFGGWLPGSAEVSGTASSETGGHGIDRIHMQPYTRAAIQMGIAVGVAIALGVLISSYRFYWAVIAAFITFMGVNNSGEQVRKALFRVAGTIVGIGIGSLIVDVVGRHTDWSIAVILVSLFLGLYLMRINYAFMVVGITVMVSQLYVELGEFSNSLLLLRLEETALGAGVAIAVVLLVFPLRTRRVLRVAFREHIKALQSLVGHASSRLVTGDAAGDTTLRVDARIVDASYQALVQTAQPLRRNLFGSLDEDTARAVRLASASRNYARNLVADVESASFVDPLMRMDLERASATLQRSMEVLVGAANGPRDGTYVRTSALFDRTERRLEGRSSDVDGGWLAIRDFKLIDGAMAAMADVMGLGVADYDTVDAA